MKTRAEMGQQIIDLVTGQNTQESLAAQADALATSIGGICYLSDMSLTAAIAVLTDLHGEMETHLIENWGQIERGDH